MFYSNFYSNFSVEIVQVFLSFIWVMLKQQICLWIPLWTKLQKQEQKFCDQAQYFEISYLTLNFSAALILFLPINVSTVLLK